MVSLSVRNAANSSLPLVDDIEDSIQTIPLFYLIASCNSDGRMRHDTGKEINWCVLMSLR